MKNNHSSFNLLGLIGLAIFLCCLSFPSFAQDKKSILQPYEILSTDIVGIRQGVSIQEGLSDIWGAMVEYSVDTNKDTYIFMQEITTMPNDEKRNNSNPKLTGNPDTYQMDNWLAWRASSRNAL